MKRQSSFSSEHRHPENDSQNDCSHLLLLVALALRGWWTKRLKLDGIIEFHYNTGDLPTSELFDIVP